MGFGRPRDQIIGVSFVTSEGVEVKGGGRVVKNVAGYDFPKLLTGSMGTLGIITQMTLKVRPLPEASAIAWVPFDIARSRGRPPRRAQYLGDASGGARTLEPDGRPSIGEPLELAAGGWVVAVGLEDNAPSVAWQLDRSEDRAGPGRPERSARTATRPASGRPSPSSRPGGLGPVSLRGQPAAVPRRRRSSSRLDPTAVGRPGARGQRDRPRSRPWATGTSKQAAAEIDRLRAVCRRDGGNLIVARCPTDWKERLRVWGEPRADWVLAAKVKQALDPRGADEPGAVRGRRSDLMGNSCFPRGMAGVDGAWRPKRSDIDAGIDLDWLARKIEYRHFQECVHCGLCTASCPTYVETCNENDSPRGRIYLMRAVTDGRLAMGPDVRRHLDLCLDCRACESACPSGVQYGKLIEPFKIALQKDAPPGAGPASSSG